MEKAKQVARDFLSKDGKHDTTVDQDIRGAVTQEHVRPHQHENITTAVRKEVHQDHHQTREQPVLAKETLPEKHTHNVLPIEKRTVEHGNAHEDGLRLKQDAAKYKSSSTTERTTHSASEAPTMVGENIHHHVHEHIQPVIQKETYAPETIHTTVPIHETHHKPAVHHDTTTLPAKTLEEFAGTGGSGILKGRETRTLQDYEGCPKPLKEGPGVLSAIHGENMSGTSRTTGENMGGVGSSSGGYENPSYNTSSRAEGATAGGAAVAAAQTSAERNSKTMGLGGATGTHTHHNTRSSHQDPAARDAKVGGLGRDASGGMSNLDETSSSSMGSRNAGTTGAASGTSGHRKPSLMDKLNPKKDADGDGKTGFLD